MRRLTVSAKSDRHRGYEPRREGTTATIRRPAVTLVETLVAIFVMGLGMLALLVLFPFGALTMAQAIKDDRTAHAAGNAKATLAAWNIPKDPQVAPNFVNPGGGLPRPGIRIP